MNQIDRPFQSAPAIDNGTSPDSRTERVNELRSRLATMSKAVIAYSGGVDSAYLAYEANRVMSKDAICVLGLSPSVSKKQRDEAFDIAANLGLNLRTIETSEFHDPSYIANPSNRCYFCKSELYGKLGELAGSLGIVNVLDGTNADDLADVRHGRQAAEEKGLKSPLAESGLTKQEIRELSRQNGVPGWDRPASPCLSSRIAQGVPVTIGRVGQVEQAEQFLREMGFRELRVRVHGELARIELGLDEIERAMELERFQQISGRFRKLGFKFTTLDMEGFRSGSLNVEKE